MSLLNFLQLQPIDPHDDGLSDDTSAMSADDTIILEDHPDEQQLEAFWNTVTKDIEQDPDWFKFNND